MREALLHQPGRSLSRKFEGFRQRLKSSFDNDVDFYALVGKSYTVLTGGYDRYDRDESHDAL